MVQTVSATVTPLKRGRGRPPKVRPQTAIPPQEINISGLSESGNTSDPFDLSSVAQTLERDTIVASANEDFQERVRKTPPISSAQDIPPDDEYDRLLTSVTKRPEKLEKQVTELYMSLALLVGVFNMGDSIIIIQAAPQRAKELNDIANANPEFKKFLKRLVSGSVYSTAVIGHVALILALAQNHGFSVQTLMQRRMTQANSSGSKQTQQARQLTQDELRAYEEILKMGEQFPQAGEQGVTPDVSNPVQFGLDNQRR